MSALSSASCHLLLFFMLLDPALLPAATLPEALDGPGIASAASSGTPPWFGEEVAANAHDGVDAARSGAIASNGQTQLSATVTGPGTLRFWWKVSSERTYDFGWWRLDGGPQPPISGESGWQEVTAVLTPGSHTLEWFYQKDGTVTAGADALWVDRLQVVPAVSTTLAQALDLTSPFISIAGAVGTPWSGWGAPYANHDGVDAARSGAGSPSRLILLVTGPGIFSAWTRLNGSIGSLDPWMGIMAGWRPYSGTGQQAWSRMEAQIPPGQHNVVFDWGTNNGNGTNPDTAGYVDQVSFQPAAVVSLAAALDTSGLTWTTDLDKPWDGLAAPMTTHDGVDAARSASVGNTSPSGVQTTVSGSGVVTFWWRTDGKDSTRSTFSVDGSEKLLVMPASANITDGEWYAQSVEVTGAGAHTLRWEFSNPSSGGCLWLDQVVWTPGGYVSVPLDAAVGSTGLFGAQPSPSWQGLQGPGLGRGGNSAARSGPSSSVAETLRATITGPGQLSWWWRSDYVTRLNVIVNGSLRLTEEFGRNWQQMAMSIPAGPHTVDWQHNWNYTAFMDDVVFTPAGAPPGLADAVDAPALVWRSSGPGGPWMHQTVETHDGSDAVRAPVTPHGGSSWIEADITGPGMLRFAWKVSSEPKPVWTPFGSGDQLSLWLSNQSSGSPLPVEGESGWVMHEVPITYAGVQRARWTYGKNATGSAGQDTAWLDAVSFTPSGPVSLAEALDAPSLTWTAGGSGAWAGAGGAPDAQTGGDFAQSPAGGPAGVAWIETLLPDGGNISAWCRASGSTGNLLVRVDGQVVVTQTQANATGFWRQMHFYVPAGAPHTVRFECDNASGSWQVDDMKVTAIPASLTLVEALDAPAFTWTTGGTNGWTVTAEAGHTHDGLDGARALSGGVLQTTASGPVAVSGWWRRNGAGINFASNGRAAGTTSTTNNNWERFATEFVTPGGKQLTWTQSVGLYPPGLSAELDEVSITPLAPVALDAALDGTGLTWQTSTAAPWAGYVLPATAFDAGDAAAGVSPETATPSWIESQSTGAGALTFRYRNGATGAREGTFQFQQDGGTSYPLNESNWTRVLRPVPAPGTHTTRWTLAALSPAAAPGAALLDTVEWHPAIALGEALDAPAFAWATGGTGWVGLPDAAATAWSGSDCAVSHVGPNETATLETTFTGPGMLGFSMKMDPWGLATLALAVNGVAQWSTASVSSWTPRTQVLGPGTHTVRWTHSRGAGGAAHEVLAQLDGVTFTPAAASSLEPALDLPGLTLRTGGTGGWMNQSTLTRDGEDALQSDFISEGNESWIEFDATGAQFATFFIAAAALPKDPYGIYSARVLITVDGTRQFQDSAPLNGTWKRITVRLPESGAHTVRLSNFPAAPDTTPFSLLVDQLSVEPLTAVDLQTATGWAGAFSTSAAGSWQGFSAAAAGMENGALAAVGNLDFTGTVWMETTATGPGRFYFTQRRTPSLNYQAGSFSRRLRVDGALRFAEGNSMFVDLGPGAHTLRWEYVRTGSTAPRAPDWHVGEFRMLPGTTLADALDTSALTWTTDAAWGGLLSATEARDAVDFALADEATGYGGWLQAVIPGPGVLSFWLHESGSGGTVLRPTVNGWDTPWTMAETGTGGWVRVTLPLRGSSQTVRFQLWNPAGTSGGTKSFRLDEAAVLPASAITLPEALDAEDLPWSTGPHAWAGLASGGADWAVSSDVLPGARSWLETMVPGPGLIRYRAGIFGTDSNSSGILSVWLPSLEPESPSAGGIGVDPAWRENQRVIVSGSGPQRVRWTYRDRDATYGNTTTTAALDAVSFSPALPLAQVLGNSGLTFSTAPEQPWIGVADEIVWPAQPVHAVSGPALEGRASWLETQITGPASLRFHWLAGGIGAAPGTLWCNGRLVTELNDSDHCRLLVPPGLQTVRWECAGSTAAGARLAAVELLPSLGTPMEWPEQPWLLRGEGLWSVGTAASHDTVDSLTLPGPATTLRSYIYGPGTYSGWYREGTAAWTQFSHLHSWPGGSRMFWGPSGSSIPGPRALDEFNFTPAPAVPLAEALDAPALLWTTGGAAQWAGYGAPIQHVSGGDAAAPGIVRSGETTWLESSVAGPGRLTFSTSGSLKWSLNGVIVPAVGGVSAGVPSFQTYTLLLPSGVHTVRWEHTCPPDALFSAGAILDNVAYTPDTAADDLAEAMDAPSFPWTAIGPPGWHVQTTVTQDGSDAAGAIEHGPQSLQTTVPGPGTVAFWWRRDWPVNSNVSLTFQANSEAPVSAPWNAGWVRHERLLTAAGPQLLTWNLTQPASGFANGVDNCWLDRFSFVPAPAVSLGVAVDAPALTWQTNPDTPWIGVAGALFSGDGSDAAAAGQPAPGADSWLETEVTGPGTVSFLWRRSSGAAPLVCEIDGQFRGSTTGADFKPAWFTFETGGTHTIRWVLRRPLDSDPVGAAAVDSFNFTPAPPESNYHAYAAAYLPEALRDPLADIDLDGLTNLVEYAHGLDPELDDSSAAAPNGLSALQLITAAGSQYLELTFLRRRNASGLTQTAQFAAVPGGPWAGATVAPQVTVLNSDWERVTVRDAVAGTRRFGRVLVSWLPPEY